LHPEQLIGKTGVFVQALIKKNDLDEFLSQFKAHSNQRELIEKLVEETTEGLL